MPRTARSIAAGGFYHVLNRGNGRQKLFLRAGDYDAFCGILAEGLRRYPVKLYGWCLMPNHWHLVLSPKNADSIGRLLGWVGVTHVRRHHTHYHTVGGGHLYQGRFKSFPIEGGRHFRAVCRYVEANPRRAKLVRRAQDWRWSSLAAHVDPSTARPDDVAADDWPALTRWPGGKPADWAAWVNKPIEVAEAEAMKLSIARGRPYGSAKWIAATAKKLGLEYTLRDRGRPRKAREDDEEE
ncbi:transposase [Humisphaera borealis]|uniref:Transposase n=1 Tax=Humisphaera borealis TaxID=2807512 RepID=A0A7M2X2K0_9BACT|nr:transposase [Humisphaera borealis]QOV91915.1 transposase [Humisphaera borealis]